jgi:hypothetical protein
MNLQPEWRHDSLLLSKGKLPPGEKWDRTKIGGSNGFFIVLLTLAWWIAKFKGKVDNDSLVMALDDVEWVLDAMTCVEEGGGTEQNSVTATGKRTASMDEATAKEAPAKKKYAFLLVIL